MCNSAQLKFFTCSSFKFPHKPLGYWLLVDADRARLGIEDLCEDVVLRCGVRSRALQLPAPCSEIFPVLPVAQHSQYFQQCSCPLSGGNTVMFPVAQQQCRMFKKKRKLTRQACRGSPAAQLLFCPICTCQLINCASRRFPQRRF